MDTLLELFETDDPDQVADILMELLNQILSADRLGDEAYAEDLTEKFEEMVRLLAGAD
tara:strand:+ start:2005 stop:2178 length:174 start_codon:yes stop_codon:yes gene_type:complete